MRPSQLFEHQPENTAQFLRQIKDPVMRAQVGIIIAENCRLRSRLDNLEHQVKEHLTSKPCPPPERAVMPTVELTKVERTALQEVTATGTSS